ncbi:MAG TPA: UTP--glucose-1-phosphate uridylyltransferase [Candidatus Acidoferrales bacterium]|nr:UTP--glucose-1-phosphate uridylyltransferase [Candidatus Acidoferrales bacterium]
MSELVALIASKDPDIRDQSLDFFCRSASLEQLLDECSELEEFRHSSPNLYEQVRSLFFLYAIHRFHIPKKKGIAARGLIPYRGYEDLLNRRFEEAIRSFLRVQEERGCQDGISSALAVAYRSLGFQTLADQVRASVRSVRGNQWMFRTGHLSDHPLHVIPTLLQKVNGLYPILHEQTPVRMDLSHSGWSDIFFLGMDFPEGARVLNISIDLAVQDQSSPPRPPVEVFFRTIDAPVIRLVSTDLGASTEIVSFAQLFDFAADYLGLLKAAVIASGIVPPGMEGLSQTFSDLLSKVVGPGLGIEIVSQVNGIPKGSRLAVSTTLLASIIAVCMRATGQTSSLTGSLIELERRTVAARAILGEWLGGSGGGWQDSGGVWSGIKLIQGVQSGEEDIEFGVSRGCLLPHYVILGQDDVSLRTRRQLQESLLLVHGGMAQDVGPILEMVTERYLLRSKVEWDARKKAHSLFDEIVAQLKKGDVQSLGGSTQENFFGPIQTIIPWATNLYTESVIAQVQAEFGKDFWGFLMLGGMSGGGMGFFFHPRRKRQAQKRLQEIMNLQKKRFEHGIPFAMEPVVYDFAINEKGSSAELLVDENALMPRRYYTLMVPLLLRKDTRTITADERSELEHFSSACKTNPSLDGTLEQILSRILPESNVQDSQDQTLENLLEHHGFDRVQHEQIKADLRVGRIGLAQNRLPVSTTIIDVGEEDVFDVTKGIASQYYGTGSDAIASGMVAVLTLAAGAGSRWTKGAGTVKALNPFCRISGAHRTFIEAHLAKSRKTMKDFGAAVPHMISTGYLTHDAIKEYLEQENYYGYVENAYLSPGSNVGLRLIPTVRDLRFAWLEMPQQLLDEQAQKVLESFHKSLMDWAERNGEATDYTDNVPLQCLNPAGHWYEIPNLLRNGVLSDIVKKQPHIKFIMVHNIDTMGANIDPGILGWHIESKAGMTVEVITRRLEDRGGGLAKTNGRLRLIEGLAMPREEDEFNLSYYNSATYWIDIDQLLGIFGLDRSNLDNHEKVKEAVRTVASRMPTYITLKSVKKRWGKGQEDVFPTLQYEKLWGDMTILPELSCSYIVVPRERGQQLKEPAQMDGWLRDGSAEYLQTLCEWES